MRVSVNAEALKETINWAELGISDRSSDYLGEELASVGALDPQPLGWQPIETAPKDGRMVLLWEKPLDITMEPPWGHQAYAGKWIKERETWATMKFCAMTHVVPAHWMPLPAAPSEGGE